MYTNIYNVCTRIFYLMQYFKYLKNNLKTYSRNMQTWIKTKIVLIFKQQNRKSILGIKHWSNSDLRINLIRLWSHMMVLRCWVKFYWGFKCWSSNLKVLTSDIKIKRLSSYFGIYLIFIKMIETDLKKIIWLFLAFLYVLVLRGEM